MVPAPSATRSVSEILGMRVFENSNNFEVIIPALRCWEKRDGEMVAAAAAADRGATAVRTSLDNMASENADHKCVLPGLPRSAANQQLFFL